MKWFLYALSALVVLAMVGGAYFYLALNGTFITRLPSEDLQTRLKPSVQVYAPDRGAGPFPVVVMFHGCGGVREIQERYAQRVRDAGVMAVVVDSLGPRGITYQQALTQVCSGIRLRGRERAGDVIAAMEIVRQDPRADADNIALLGWSHGAWSIMDAFALGDGEKARPHNLKAVPERPFAGVKGAFLVYPYCSFPALTINQGWQVNAVPVTALLLQGDTTASPADCRAAFAMARESGASVKVMEWSGLTHAFDEKGHNPASGYVFDPEGAARAERTVVNWLRETLDMPDATPAETVITPDGAAAAAGDEA